MRLKLGGLKRKEELVACQMQVDEDVQAVKRKAERDIVALL